MATSYTTRPCLQTVHPVGWRQPCGISALPGTRATVPRPGLSRRRDLNPRPPPWQGGVPPLHYVDMEPALIPTELYRHAFRGLGSNQRALDPKSRRDAVNPPRSESRLPDSNRPPFPYRGIAQPAELRRHVDGALSGCCIVSRPCRRAPTRRHCVRGGIRTLTPLSGHQHLKLACLPFQHADLLSTYRHSSCHRKALHGPSSGYYVRAWRSVSQGSRTEDR